MAPYINKKEGSKIPTECKYMAPYINKKEFAKQTTECKYMAPYISIETRAREGEKDLSEPNELRSTCFFFSMAAIKWWLRARIWLLKSRI